MGIAWANLLLALMKGFRDAAGNALSLIAGSLIGVAAYYACYRFGGYQGALLGLALVPALVVVPAASCCGVGEYPAERAAPALG
jgi:antigen flippase